MPELLTAAVAAIGAEVGGALGATMIMNAGAIATGVVVGGGLALSASQAKRAKQKAKDAYNAAQVDRFANVVTTIAPRDLVLGRVRKGGAVVFRGSAGTNKTYFLVHLALAGHEIDAVEQVYFNDEPVTLASSGAVTTAPYTQTQRISESGPTNSIPEDAVPGSVITPIDPQTGLISDTSSWQRDISNSFATVWWDLGAPGSAAESNTLSLFPELWNSSRRGEGVAKLFALFTYNENAYPSGLPVVTARIRGAKVYDPRSGSTAWSDNPALLARHVYQHAYFGKAAVSADEDARFTVSANGCDTSHTYTLDDGTSETVALYRAGLVAPYGTPARDLLDDLAQAMAGTWAFAGGELFIKAGVYTASVKSLTDSDLAVIQRSGESEQQEPVSISVHRERVQKFNTVNARIWDAGQDYKQVALSPVKSSALITRDGIELAQEVTLSAVGYAPQAQHVCGVMMRDARDPLTVEAPFKMVAWPIEIFDTIAWTSSRYGWAGKTFEVRGRRWDRARGVVWLTLKETAAAIYTPDATFLAQGYAANTALPSPWDISPPGSLAAVSGTSELVASPSGGVLTRVRVTWAPVQDSGVAGGGEVEIQWSYFGLELEWNSIRVPGSATELFITGPADGSSIIIRARSSSALAASAWGVQIAHTVVGQTARPAAVSGLSVVASSGFALVGWTLHEALDVLYGGEIVIRHSPLTVGAAWEDGYILDSFDGRLVSGIVPLITGTYMAKAKDRSGNWSETAVTFVATEGMVTGFNTVATSTQDPAFAGSKTGLVATDDVLKLDGITLVDDMADSVDDWGFIDALGGLESSGEYLFDTYVDSGTVAVRRYEADIKVLAYDAADLIDLRTEPIDSWDAIDGDEVNGCDVTLYAATTNTDPAGAPLWGAWTPFMVADFNCRAAKFKLEVTSAFPTHNINIEQLRVAVKEPA